MTDVRIEKSGAPMVNGVPTWNVTLNGRVVLLEESYAVCSWLADALLGHRAGCPGEILEVADSILG